MTRGTLVVTNDFPPRSGGIESYVHALVSRLDADDVVVYARGQPDAAAFDATLPFPVVRHARGIMVAEPSVARRAAALVREHGCTSVWFGAAAPLGLLAPGLRRAGAQTVVASTHGHELWWARVPAARQALRRIGEGCDALTYLGGYTRDRIAPALRPAARERMVQLPPGVDDQVFRPDADAREQLRDELGLAERPVVLCVSRLVERKGQDTLLRALPAVRAAVPDVVLLLVGRGPYERRLRTLAAALGVEAAVQLVTDVPTERLPAYYAAADVFAMPCRSRRGGLEVEGLGIVYLEASASGLAVVGGDSGGAPDAVLDGETGYVVDGRSAAAVAGRLIELLGDAALRARLGARGRAWVAERWRWDTIAARLDGLLHPAAAGEPRAGQL